MSGWMTVYNNQHWWRTLHHYIGPSQFSEHLAHLSHLLNLTIHWIWHITIPLILLWRTQSDCNQGQKGRILYWANTVLSKYWMLIGMVAVIMLAQLWPQAWQVVTGCWTTRLCHSQQLVGLTRWIYSFSNRFFLLFCQLVAFVLQGFDTPSIQIVHTFLLTF